jgi:hypothetical protein
MHLAYFRIASLGSVGTLGALVADLAVSSVPADGVVDKLATRLVDVSSPPQATSAAPRATEQMRAFMDLPPRSNGSTGEVSAGHLTTT